VAGAPGMVHYGTGYPAPRLPLESFARPARLDAGRHRRLAAGSPSSDSLLTAHYSPLTVR